MTLQFLFVFGKKWGKKCGRPLAGRERKQTITDRSKCSQPDLLRYFSFYFV